MDSLNPTGESDDGLIRGVLFIAIWGVYEPIAMVFGSTLGNYLMKIRVREHGNTTKRINILQSYIRFVIKILLGWLSFITISANKERRAIHDLVSGSIMIEKAMN